MKKSDDIVGCLDTMREYDRQTDRQTTSDGLYRAYAYRRAGNGFEITTVLLFAL